MSSYHQNTGDQQMEKAPSYIPLQEQDTQMGDAGTTAGYASRAVRARPSTHWPKQFKSVLHLSPAEKAQVLDHNKDLYQETIQVNCNPDFHVSTEGIFELRNGIDGPPKSIAPGKLEGKCAAMMYVDDLQANTCWVGEHLDLTADEARFRGDDTEGKQPPKRQAPPHDYTLYVEHHLDSQLPNIRLSHYDTHSGKTIAAKIYAENLAWLDAGYLSPIYVDNDNIQADLEGLTNGFGQAKKLIEMTTMKKHDLVRVNINLKCSHYDGNQQFDTNCFVWEGLSTERRDELDRQETIDGPASQFYHAMKNAVSLQIFTVRPKSQIPKWVAVSGYMQRLFTITAYLGHFWFYRHQVWINGHQGDREAGIEGDELPEINWETPRWLVTAYQFDDVEDEDGNTRLENPVPCQWNAHPVPKLHNNPNELAFLLKLSIQEERTRQFRDLQEIFQTDDTLTFEGRFHKVPDQSKHYAVEVTTSHRDCMREQCIGAPPPGTRLVIHVDPSTPYDPQEGNLIKMTGVVVSNAFGRDVDFTAIISGSDLSIIDENAVIPLRVEYIFDRLPIQRQMQAVSKIQAINSWAKPAGPDVKNIILGCDIPVTKSVDWKPSSDDLNKIQCLLAASPRQPNQGQLAAIMHSLSSKAGITVILGPPGTGKTATEIAIGTIRTVELGHRVMFTAPQNSAVKNLIRAWIKKSAIKSLITHGNLQRRQEFLTKDQEDAEEALMNAVREADARGATPNYEWTFGYKRSKRIEEWSKDVSHPMHHAANEYMQYINDDLKTAKAYMADAEAELGAYFLREEVKTVFCTLSSSAHEFLQAIPHWNEIIIEEAAHEHMAGLCPVLGAFIGRVDHFTFAGDHQQAHGMVVSSDSNVGYNMIRRNVFQSLVEGREDAEHIQGNFLLDRCYRMSNNLMSWSSQYCYGGRVHSDPSTDLQEPELCVTLAAFWAMRRATDGGYENIGLDVTAKGIASVQPERENTRINLGEAQVICWLLKDMLEFSPPPTGRIISGADIHVISNYSGQVKEISRQIAATCTNLSTMAPIPQQVIAELKKVQVVSTNLVQGSERNIAIYSTVIATGTERATKDNRMPLRFVSDKRNFNVSLTRQKIARVIVGAIQLFIQARVDNHPSMQYHNEQPFYQFFQDLKDNGNVISWAQITYFMNTGQRPVGAPGIIIKPKATAAESSTIRYIGLF